MTTSPFKISEDTVVDLAAEIMKWKKIGHILVQDQHGKLVGLINKDAIINFLVDDMDGQETVRAGEIMIRKPITASPDTSIEDAIALILDHNISSLPVVKDGQPVGIVTKQEFVTTSKVLISELEREN